MCSPATLRQSLVLRMHIMSVISAVTLWQSLNPYRMYVSLYVYYKVCVFSCTTTTQSQFRILCMHIMSVTVLSLAPLRQSLTLRPICLHMLESDTYYVLYYVLIYNTANLCPISVPGRPTSKILLTMFYKF